MTNDKFTMHTSNTVISPLLLQWTLGNVVLPENCNQLLVSILGESA